MSESIDKKADRYLTEGRVVVLSLSPDSGHFQVTGSDIYTVDFNGVWDCDCPARVDRCAHIAACQKITAFNIEKSVMFTGDDEASLFLANLFKD